jgi:hypothetical protein
MAQYFMHKKCLLVAVFLSASLFLNGCVTKMALQAKKGPPSLAAKSVGLFTLRTENQYKPSYQPYVRFVEIKDEKTQDGKKFKTDKANAEGKDQFVEYLISIELAPGNYTLGDILGYSSGFLISGHYKFPVNARFQLAPGSMTYLGHVAMVNRERKEGEKRSGAILPLIDQSVSGFSSGTFDITISDRRDADMAAFVQAYPYLKGLQIGNSIMQK